MSNFSPQIPRPSLRTLLDKVKREVKEELNSHATGTIQVFDKENKTATVSVNYKKVFYKRINSEFVPENNDYPLLFDCPVIFLGGGGSKLTFPIAEGDQCLVLFNDRDLDNWIKGSNTSPPASDRLHDLSDGIALVGLDTISADVDSDRAVLEHNSARVAVGKNSKVLIENNISTLNSLLSNLITNIQGLTTTPTIPGVPATLSPATIALLTLDAIAIGNLLE